MNKATAGTRHGMCWRCMRSDLMHALKARKRRGGEVPMQTSISKGRQGLARAAFAHFLQPPTAARCTSCNRFPVPSPCFLQSTSRMPPCWSFCSCISRFLLQFHIQTRVNCLLLWFRVIPFLASEPSTSRRQRATMTRC